VATPTGGPTHPRHTPNPAHWPRWPPVVAWTGILACPVATDAAT
jgi:hypothetical protein